MEFEFIIRMILFSEIEIPGLIGNSDVAKGLT